MLDAIIVGYGLAGFHYAWQMKQHQKKFLVIADPFVGASRKAAGICNPTVLKRYTMAWEGKMFLDFALKHYATIEAELDNPFFHSLPIHRYFFNGIEQNEWLVASQRSGLSSFLNPEIEKTSDKTLKDKAGYGIVEHLGKLDIKSMLNCFKEKEEAKSFWEEVFDYEALKIHEYGVIYKGIKAKSIVFCEGFGLKKNPWFDYLPLVGSKGEYLIIKAPELSRKRIVKGAIFIAPIENDLFWIGASFSQKDKTEVPTDLGKDWLIQKLNSILNIPYEVINHEAAVRPTVSDRRPLLGVHPSYSNLYVFNGLGTRGVLMAPKLSQWLYEFVHQRKQFPNEVAIDRFESYFSSPKTKYV